MGGRMKQYKRFRASFVLPLIIERPCFFCGERVWVLDSKYRKRPLTFSRTLGKTIKEDLNQWRYLVDKRDRVYRTKIKQIGLTKLVLHSCLGDGTGDANLPLNAYRSGMPKIVKKDGVDLP